MGRPRRLRPGRTANGGAERNLGSSNVADLNRDGYLDLVLGAFEAKKGKNFLVIRYGSKDGFSRPTGWRCPSTIAPSAAWSPI